MGEYASDNEDERKWMYVGEDSKTYGMISIIVLIIEGF